MTGSERTIFLEALDIDDPAERAAFLDRACGDEAELRQRVERLLEAIDAAGSFLDTPAVTGSTGNGRTFSQPEHVRSSKDPARSSAPTSCWSRSARAAWASSTWPSRPSPSGGKVALKIIKPGMDTAQVIARFEAERQALALMDHPNIARVLDAGATDTGRPYFVMELVKGVPITEYCDEQPAHAAAAAGAVRPGLPGGPARAPEGDHPPRPQAVERPGRRSTTASRCPR